MLIKNLFFALSLAMIFLGINCMEKEAQELFDAVEKNNPLPLQQKRRRLAHVVDKQGNTVLHKAVVCENADMIQELLKLAPALKNQNNSNQQTPSQLAKSPEIKRLLK